MLSNEQRAHDLAISILQGYRDDIIRRVAEENPDTTEVAFDIYSEYKSLYNSALKVINRDFPNHK